MCSQKEGENGALLLGEFVTGLGGENGNNWGARDGKGLGNYRVVIGKVRGIVVF